MKKLMIAVLGLSLMSGLAVFADDAKPAGNKKESKKKAKKAGKKDEKKS